MAITKKSIELVESRKQSKGSSAAAKSKKLILRRPTEKPFLLPPLVTALDVVEYGAVEILGELRKQHEQFDRRSHAFLHRQVVSAYQVARSAFDTPRIWQDICDCAELKDAPRKPKIDRPEDALKFALMISKGVEKKNRSFVSNWFNRLKDDFEKRRPPGDVLKSLSRKATASPSVVVKDSSRNKSSGEKAAGVVTKLDPMMIGDSDLLSGRFDLGFWNGLENGVVDFRVTDGKCARVWLRFELYESETAATSLARVETKLRIKAIEAKRREIMKRHPLETDRDYVRRILGRKRYEPAMS